MTTKQTILYVTYTGDAGSRFDRDYYLTKHMKLVQAVWGATGLESGTAFFPATSGSGVGTIAIAELKFRDQAAVEASLSSPDAARVMADVKVYTDITPQVVRVLPL